MSSPSTIITVNTWTTEYGVNVCEVMTTGEIGSEAEAKAAAEREIGPDARLSFRKSDSGTLTITYNDERPEG